MAAAGFREFRRPFREMNAEEDEGRVRRWRDHVGGGEKRIVRHAVEMGGPFIRKGGERRDGTRLLVDDFDIFEGAFAESLCFGGGARRRPVKFETWAEIVFKNDSRDAFDKFVDGQFPTFRDLEGDAVPGEKS